MAETVLNDLGRGRFLPRCRILQRPIRRYDPFRIVQLPCIFRNARLAPAHPPPNFGTDG